MVKFYSTTLRKNVEVPNSKVTAKAMYVNGKKKYMLVGKCTEKKPHNVYKFTDEATYKKFK